MMNLGIDVGGTGIKGSAVAEDGTLRHRSERVTPAQDVDAIAGAIADLVRELVDLCERGGEPVGAVGVACAGFVDAAGGTVLFAPNLAWRDAPLKARLEEAVGRPIFLENDANAAAWGEFRFGGAREADDMLLVTVGTGVGGGIVSDGELLRGSEGVAAEIGHLRVQPEGLRCGCGNRGCLEAYASGTALVREGRELVAGGSPHAGALSDLCGGDPERLTGHMVTQAATAGDPAAIELFADLGRWLGEGVASLVAVLDPELIVIGGGVSEAGDLLLQPARVAFGRQLTGRGHRRQAEIVPALLGNDAGMIGAADLAARRAGVPTAAGVATGGPAHPTTGGSGAGTPAGD
ncbi:ROK family glucokinase [Ornithinimicrobium cavernae]|uniref:ROK family glucokinase n=1 Tax=Ornithinimicrobium cavernae TaxID=2666047 RepID=UPI00192A525F|nr:ROK family glucokinase [Ornithinimicrobium cavernae]